MVECSGAEARPLSAPVRPALRTLVPLPGLLALWTACGCVLSAYLITIPERVSIAVHLVGLAMLGSLLAARYGAVSLRIFLVVFPVALVATLCLYSVYLDRYDSPYYIGGSDDLAYERDGQAVAESLGLLEYGSIRGNIVKPTHNSVGYVYFVSLLYRSSSALAGFHTLIPRFVNSAALAVLASFTYVLGRRCRLEPSMATAAGLYTGLAPIMLYTAAHTFRDTLTSLITIAVVLQCVAIGEEQRRFGVLRFITAAVATLVLSQLRKYQAVALLAVITSADFARPVGSLRFENVGRWVRQLVLFVSVGAALLFIISPFGRALWEGVVAAVLRYTTYRQAMADGLSRFVFEAPIPWAFALRTLYALVTPLPEFTHELDRLWLSGGTIVQALALPYLAIGVVTTVRSRRWWLVLSAFAVLFLGMAMVSFTSRHIAQWLPYAALVAAGGYTHNRSSRSILVLAAGAYGVLLGVVYMVAKAAL